MKKTKLLLSSSILSTIALVPALLGSCANTVQASKKGSIINSVTIGSFKYDLDTVNNTATLIGPDASGTSFNTIPDSVTHSSKDYIVTAIADHAFDNFTKFTIGAVTIGANVLTIGDYAFYRCKNITSISLNSSLTNIGNYAFTKCINMTGNCFIPASVVTIGDGAFEDTAIQYASSSGSYDELVSIGAAAFRNCSKLKTIGTFPKIQSIGASAFSGCSQLTGTATDAITIPTTCTKIGALAFKGCTGLETKGIKFASGIYWSTKGTEQDDSPFVPSTDTPSDNYDRLVSDGPYKANNLTKYIPVTKITLRVKDYPASGLFQLGDEGSVEVVVEPSNATCKDLWIDCMGSGCKFDPYGKTFVINGDNSTFWFETTAADGSGVKGQSISYSVGECPVQNIQIHIPKRAFINTKTRIGSEVTLAESVPEESEAQYKQVKYSIIEGSNLATLDETTGELMPLANGKIKVKAESKWFSGRFSIGEFEIGSTLRVENGVCEGFWQEALEAQGSSVTEGPIHAEYPDGVLKMPAEVTEIAANSFGPNTWGSEIKKCPRCITALDFSAATNLTTIGENAFNCYQGAGALSGALTLPSSIETIGNAAFANNQGFTSIDLSSCSNLASLGNSCFSGTSACSSILLPENATNFTSIPQSAFSNCREVVSITIPKTITSIGDYAFNTMNKLAEIVFADDSTRWTANNVKYSVADPATNCTNFKANEQYTWTKVAASEDFEYEIPEGSTSATITAWTGTDAVVELPTAIWKDGVKYYITKINEGVFNGNKTIKSIHLPDKLETIGGQAFNGCTNLTEINFPSTLTTITGQNTFRGCTGLTEIDLSSTQLTIIPATTFWSCTGVKTCKLPTGLTSLGGRAFQGLGSNTTGTTLEIPNLPKNASIGDTAFSDAKITTIIAGANAVAVYGATAEVGGGLFANCTKLYVPTGTSISTYLSSTLGFAYDSTEEGYDLYTRTI